MFLPMNSLRAKFRLTGDIERSEKVKRSSGSIWDAFALFKTGFKQLGYSEQLFHKTGRT